MVAGLRRKEWPCGGHAWFDSRGHPHHPTKPAQMFAANGVSCWMHHGEHHRHPRDGPAIVSSRGFRAYYWRSKRHRLDGPAVRNDALANLPVWWVDGVNVTKDDYEAAVQAYCDKNPDCPTVVHYLAARRVKAARA